MRESPYACMRATGVASAGDYFDYLTLPDGRVGFTIGDVTGHGFGPALIMASIHVMFRLLVETHQDVGEILELANSVLVNETQEDRFVTLIFACFDLETKTLVYSNAGHPSGYVLNAAGDVRARLVSMNLPLGVRQNEDTQVLDASNVSNPLLKRRASQTQTVYFSTPEALGRGE